MQHAAYSIQSNRVSTGPHAPAASGFPRLAGQPPGILNTEYEYSVMVKVKKTGRAGAESAPGQAPGGSGDACIPARSVIDSTAVVVEVVLLIEVHV